MYWLDRDVLNSRSFICLLFNFDTLCSSNRMRWPWPRSASHYLPSHSPMLPGPNPRAYYSSLWAWVSWCRSPFIATSTFTGTTPHLGQLLDVRPSTSCHWVPESAAESNQSLPQAELHTAELSRCPYWNRGFEACTSPSTSSSPTLDSRQPRAQRPKSKGLWKPGAKPSLVSILFVLTIP